MVIFLSDAFSYRQKSRDFEDMASIRNRIRDSKNYKYDGEDPDRAVMLLIFETAEQKTWLVATRKRLYCILDDLSDPVAEVQWSEKLSNLVDETGEVVAPIASRRKSKDVGAVDIGDTHHDWLFSRQLFTLAPVEHQVRDLLRQAAKAA